MKKLLVTSIVSLAMLVMVGCNCCGKRWCLGRGCSSTVPSYGEPYLPPAPEYQPEPLPESPSTFTPGQY